MHSRNHCCRAKAVSYSVPDQGALGPVAPATEALRTDSLAVTCCPEDGRLSLKGGWASLKRDSPQQSPNVNGLIIISTRYNAGASGR